MNETRYLGEPSFPELRRNSIVYIYIYIYIEIMVVLLIMCVRFLMPTHCTITCLGFRARRIDGVECDLFSIHAPLGQTTLHVGEYLYSVLEEVEVRMTVCVTLCIV